MTDRKCEHPNSVEGQTVGVFRCVDCGAVFQFRADVAAVTRVFSQCADLLRHLPALERGEVIAGLARVWPRLTSEEDNTEADDLSDLVPEGAEARGGGVFVGPGAFCEGPIAEWPPAGLRGPVLRRTPTGVCLRRAEWSHDGFMLCAECGAAYERERSKGG